MAKYKHMTLEERYKIKAGLDRGDSFKEIARATNKDCTTISKEVRNRRVFEKVGCAGNKFNDCVHRYGCDVKALCTEGNCRGRRCVQCVKMRCSKVCTDFERVTCAKHSTAPYVCNGCADRNRCTLLKSFYKAVTAQKDYEVILKESREGLDIDEDEIARLNSVVSPLLKKGQSLHHVCVNNASRIMRSERTMYNYVKASLFTARNIDMPRTVRFRVRAKARSFKVDKACHVNRTYADYLAFRKGNPDIPVVEMDTVHGNPGGKCVLTLHFVTLHYMLMILLEECTAWAVSAAFASLRRMLGAELFGKLFPLILTDRGTEFTDPTSIEFDEEGEGRSRVYFCDPQQSQQKGAAENNHSLMRRIIPKGKSLDGFTQSDITKMMNNVNSYGRPSLNDRSPHELLVFAFGKDTPKKWGAELIPADEIILRPALLQ